MKKVDLLLLTLIYGVCISPLVQSQFTDITSDQTGCSVLVLTTEVDPPSPNFQFEWTVFEGSTRTTLVTVTLNGSGGIVITNNANNNPFMGQYEVSHNPDPLPTNVSPFNSSLTFNNVTNTPLSFAVVSSSVTMPTLPFMLPQCNRTADRDCTNCGSVTTLQCFSAVSQKCQYGPEFTLDCPPDVSTFNQIPCIRSMNDPIYIGMNVAAMVAKTLALVLITLMVVMTWTSTGWHIGLAILLTAQGLLFGLAYLIGLSALSNWLAAGIIYIICAFVPCALFLLVCLFKVAGEGEELSRIFTWLLLLLCIPDFCVGIAVLVLLGADAGLWIGGFAVGLALLGIIVGSVLVWMQSGKSSNSITDLEDMNADEKNEEHRFEETEKIGRVAEGVSN